MTPSEFAELRHIVDRCLDGTVSAQMVGARFGELMALYFEASYQANRRGEPQPFEFPIPEQISAVEKLRLLELLESARSVSSAEVEWLPLGGDGAV